MIDANKELFVWGPIDGRPIYVFYFMTAINKLLAKKYLYGWSEIFFFFKKTKMTFICDNDDLVKVGEKHFLKWFMDGEGFKKIKNDYKNALISLKQIQKNITKESLNSLDDKQFKSVYLKWYSAYLNFWGVGLVPELANWGGEKLLKEELLKITHDEKEFLYLMEKLSAPEGFSFYQLEELDLLRLRKYQGNEKKFNSLIKKHTANYFWLRNSYFEQEVLTEDYFKKELAKLTVKQANTKINEIKGVPVNARKQKELLFRKYKLPNKTRKISKQLSYSIWWQDSRKAQIFTANHHIDLFLKQISLRKNMPFLDLKFYSDSELKNLVANNQKVPAQIIKERKKKCAGHHRSNKLTLETGDLVNKLIKPFLTVKVDKRIKEIKGMVVSAGKGNVVGKVKILLTPRNLHQMDNGDVLVTSMTSPDFVLAMRKASAIITDFGGMTSHAAIVSRELGIPCIVGTKIATKVLKDGVFVEVDTEKGVVKIRG